MAKMFKTLSGAEIPLHEVGMCECSWCAEITENLCTKMCDDCWELETRIKRNPVIARKILDKVAPLPAFYCSRPECDYYGP